MCDSHKVSVTLWNHLRNLCFVFLNSQLEFTLTFLLNQYVNSLFYRAYCPQSSLGVIKTVTPAPSVKLQCLHWKCIGGVLNTERHWSDEALCEGEGGERVELGRGRDGQVLEGSIDSGSCHQILNPFSSHGNWYWSSRFCVCSLIGIYQNRDIRASWAQHGVRELLFLCPKETSRSFPDPIGNNSTHFGEVSSWAQGKH